LLEDLRMHLAIDASNIRGGGGVTHLVEQLQAVDLPTYCFDSITMWADRPLRGLAILLSAR